MPTDRGRDLLREIKDAAEGRHPHRAMRVTLECGHLRLLPAISTVMGIGAYTGCGMPPCGSKQAVAERQVVNVEETGVLLLASDLDPAAQKSDTE